MEKLKILKSLSNEDDAVNFHMQKFQTLIPTPALIRIVYHSLINGIQTFEIYAYENIQ